MNGFEAMVKRLGMLAVGEYPETMAQVIRQQSEDYGHAREVLRNLTPEGVFRMAWALGAVAAAHDPEMGKKMLEIDEFLAERSGFR